MHESFAQRAYAQVTSKSYIQRKAFVPVVAFGFWLVYLMASLTRSPYEFLCAT